MSLDTGKNEVSGTVGIASRHGENRGMGAGPFVKDVHVYIARDKLIHWYLLKLILTLEQPTK